MTFAEFKNITGLENVKLEEYINSIEPKYMNSKLDKHKWCKQYMRLLRNKQLNAPYKDDLRIGLKYAIELWQNEEMSEDDFYIIKYVDGTEIYFNYEYDGKKPSLQNIVNIYYSGADACMDYYYDCIATEETWEFFKEMNTLYPNNWQWQLPKNPLIVSDMDDYYKIFEAIN